jgi:small-conductance mechanosensitive channel
MRALRRGRETAESSAVRPGGLGRRVGAAVVALGFTLAMHRGARAVERGPVAAAPSANAVAESSASSLAAAPPAPSASAALAASATAATEPPTAAPSGSIAPAPPESVAAPPVAAPASSAAAHGDSHAAPASGAAAKIHDTVVFVLRHGHGTKTADERAHAASEALTRAVESETESEVKVVRQGEAQVVYAGTVPVVELYPDDAEGSGYSTPDTHAAAVAARVRESVAEERKRSALAGTVFSFSLLVFFGLVAFYVLQKIGDFFQSVRQWTLDNPDRITGIRVQSQEVIGPTALRGGVLVTLIVGRFVAQVGVFYLWLVFALSLFESTRPYTEKLTGFVVTPLSDLAGRLAASLPLAVMAAVSGVAVYVLLRFVQLFFDGVARRQTVLPWLSPDLAAPTSVLVRAGVVLAALVLVAPLVTGDSNGALARAGSIALLALGLSSTPLLASLLVGTLVVYGRRIRVGEHAEVGGRTGKVLAVGLVDVRLRDRDGCDVRVPHLLSLLHPTRSLGMRPRVAVELPASSDASPKDVRRVLLEAASSLGDAPAVELDGVDRDAARYRVTVALGVDRTPGDVRAALVEALASAGIALGRGHATPETP